MGSIMCLVEDARGHVINLALHNFVPLTGTVDNPDTVSWRYALVYKTFCSNFSIVINLALHNFVPLTGTVDNPDTVSWRYALVYKTFCSNFSIVINLALHNFVPRTSTIGDFTYLLMLCISIQLVLILLNCYVSSSSSFLSQATIQ